MTFENDEITRLLPNALSTCSAPAVPISFAERFKVFNVCLKREEEANFKRERPWK